MYHIINFLNLYLSIKAFSVLILIEVFVLSVTRVICKKNLNYSCGKMTYTFYYLLTHTESVKNLKIRTVPGFWVSEIVRKINLNDTGTQSFKDSHKVPG